MSRYEIDDCVQKWVREDLSPEQAIGQLLLHVQHLEAEVKALQKEVGELKSEKKE